MPEKDKNQFYTEGNLAPQIDYTPDYDAEPSFQPEIIDGRKKAVAIRVNRGYTILLFLVIVLFIAVCVIYLKSEFSLIASRNEADQLKVELQKIQMENSRLEQVIHKTINLEKTYEIAVNKLNMRLPEKHEIHYVYRKAESYTIKLNQRSYSQENNNLKQFIAFILKDW